MQNTNICESKQQSEPGSCQKILKNFYISSDIQNQSKLITYKINQLDLMIQDINKRYQIVSTFCNMWEQRVKLQHDYANKLKNIYANNYLVKNIKQVQNRPSQVLFRTLVNILSKESLDHQKLAEQLNDQVLKGLKQQTVSLQSENKKNLTLVKSLRKDLQSQQDQLQKSKQKYIKKSNQLEKYKLDYINSSLLQDRDFERKNKLFLKIKELQNQVLPLKKSYQSLSIKYTDNLSTTLTKFSQVCRKVEQKQENSLKILKNSLINSQLFYSGLGAILVHETQVILSYLDPIKTQGVEISFHSLQSLQQQKKFYQVPYLNPSEYIDQTFKKIQNNSIQQLILYGKNPQYKRELSNYFQNSHCFQDFKNLKVISCYTVRIIQIFKSVFQGKQYSNSRLIQFGQLVKTKPSLRKDFIFCLQKYRLDGKFNITKQNFHHIIQLLNIFLNICALELDTYNSKQFMVLSFTYHFINQEGQKIDLQAYVKQHKIWKNIKWWECSLLQSIYEEHKVKKKKPQTNPTFSLWDIKSSSMKKVDSNQQNSTIVNICFNQLAYYLHNMQLFDLHQSDINGLAQKYIKLFGLAPKMITDLQTMCLNFKQASSPEKNDKSGL